MLGLGVGGGVRVRLDGAVAVRGLDRLGRAERAERFTVDGPRRTQSLDHPSRRVYDVATEATGGCQGQGGRARTIVRTELVGEPHDAAYV